MKSFTYLLLDITCIAIPLLASFYKKHSFYKEWNSFFKANVIVAFFFIIWDYFFTKLGVWGFNSDYLIDVYLKNLPIEEILFFVCIPYACVFSYFTFKYIIKNNPLEKVESIITYILIASFLVVTVFNFTKLYTSITFLSTGILLVFLKYRGVNMSYHYLSYVFILPFFFISNGLLTGSFFVEPIVWYNDFENLGIRVSNIPVEDSIYGMLLIFMNIELYEFFKRRQTKTHL